jgi:hypothetical protein
MTIAKGIDPAGRDYAARFGIPDTLLVPVAAVDEAAITDHIGDVVRVLGRGTPNKALLVQVRDPPLMDPRLPIWSMVGSRVFCAPMQVWVHIAYTRYRAAYRKAFPEEDLGSTVLSHAENRRSAALKGLNYVRITPVSRGSNSSSAFSEEWGVALHSDPYQMAANKKRGMRVQYADLTGLMLLLDLKLGGGVMDAVNEGQKLIRFGDE